MTSCPTSDHIFKIPFIENSDPVVSFGIIPNINTFQCVVINRYQVYIKWSLHDCHSQVDLDQYNFTVLRSFSENEEDFEEVSGPMQGVEEWLDQPQDLQRRWRKTFYKLKVEHIDSGEIKMFGHISLHEIYTPSMITLAVIDRLNLYLQKMPVGVIAYMWKAKEEGGRCNNCFDHIRGKSIDTDCPFCYGTGWIYPYSKVPIRFYLGVNPVVEATSIANVPEEGDQRSGWTTNFPDLTAKDIVYIPSSPNTIYRVIQKKWLAQERSIIGIKQAFVLSPIDRNKPEFDSFNMSRDLSEINDYLDICWNSGRKTYFGCRTGLPLKSTSRHEVEDGE